MILELRSKRLYQSSRREKESCCLKFTSPTKHEIRHFHVVVMQQPLRNVQKSVMQCKVIVLPIYHYCFFAVLVAIAILIAQAP